MLALAAFASLGVATVASAQQYPPTTDNGAVQGTDQNQGFGDGGAVEGAGANAGNGANGANGAPLPRTGSNLVPLALLGVALVGAGAFWVFTSRTQRAAQP
ncbi:LPXTG cell wall anchor domain-containing protein [Aquihabitans sp. G128]|uniref:LPXTG cell wall anchor domain-containing protein n=1 Tax=Aquihabitans sp. G128 TaxID=2849779 RepID=UPI001C214536|nr:LPXTG cell wall anchor domain-containing protein [Aquihabitans sp. G128]QXC62946.1 LPXTG cell wall anchor domain-containing protein [Aquihabitans sp. G128]